MITPRMDMRERGTLMLWSWNNMLAGEIGESVEWARLADRSVHVYGTWGGASVVMDGSNTEGDFCPLDNLKGQVISVSANALFGILQISAYVRPRVIGGDGTTNLNAVLLCRGTR